MDNAPNLRLAETNGQETDAYRLERRRALRHTVTSRVTALRTENGPEGRRNRICSLQLTNMSDTGLGGVCQEAVALDTQIAVFFPPHGPDRGFDLYGRVVRCIERDAGCEIGIRFETRAAA